MSIGRFRGDLPSRTFEFGVGILHLIDELPNNPKAWEIGRQLIRSGTAVGANVREADHAISDREFAQKCSISRKEAAETEYWLELCLNVGLLSSDAAQEMAREANELMRVLSSVVKRTHKHLASAAKSVRPAP